MGKLKSSIKSLQKSFKLQTSPICTQESKTHSFRTFDSPSSFSSSSSQNKTNIHMEFSSCFSSSTSSFITPTPKQSKNPYFIPNTHLNPKRFFFSPHNTKSIMEEVKDCSASDFCKQSEAISMVSDDPYRDFRSSMEEMVKNFELRDWQRLQELLLCYLQLNDKKTHKIILVAFVDLLMHLMRNDKDLFSFSLFGFLFGI